MTEPSPKRRREVQIDLSGLTDRQLLAREKVLRLGPFAFGPRWQSDFATALSKEARKSISQGQVGHWISGRRPVPEGLIEPIQRLAVRVCEDHERQVDRIRADWATEPPAEDIDAISRA